MSKPILSLCMPTNGIIEWVFPVLDSIYNQNCNEMEFEIVITDNGDNQSFKKKIRDYCKKHNNLNYYETKALPFLNEIESYKRAKGELIKFVNHRTKLVPGTLKKLIDYAKKNIEIKPITYFSNGEINIEKKIYEYKTFDQFVRNLSYWSSWSTGMTIWKSDLKKMSENVHRYNELFPHTDILFAERNKSKYVIDNTVIFDEIPQGAKPKGNYNLFFAFGIEYPTIILNLYRDNSISVETLRKVKEDNFLFITNLYFEYFIKKVYCSYDLNGINDMYNIFYTKRELRHKIIKIFFEKGIGKIKGIIRK